MIKIEIWFDLNCPFCYIGKRHLEEALRQFPKANLVEILWRSFELDPDTWPAKGASSTSLLAKKYGKDLQWAQRMNESMTKMAAKSGLNFQMDKVIAANSYNAHRLIQMAKSHGLELQDKMIEKLLSLKFVETKDVGDNEVLKKAAINIGVNPSEVIDVLETDEFGDEVRKDEDLAGALGIKSVPYFIFNKEEALSGARPVEDFLHALENSAQFKVTDNNYYH